MINRDCGECPFFKNEDSLGYGNCSLSNEICFCGNDCDFLFNTKMDSKQVINVFHESRRSKRGRDNKDVAPFLLEIAIDNAIRILRNKNDYGNDEGI